MVNATFYKALFNKKQQNSQTLELNRIWTTHTSSSKDWELSTPGFSSSLRKKENEKN